MRIQERNNAGSRGSRGGDREGGEKQGGGEGAYPYGAVYGKSFDAGEVFYGIGDPAAVASRDNPAPPLADVTKAAVASMSVEPAVEQATGVTMILAPSLRCVDASFSSGGRNVIGRKVHGNPAKPLKPSTRSHRPLRQSEAALGHGNRGGRRMSDVCSPSLSPAGAGESHIGRPSYADSHAVANAIEAAREESWAMGERACNLPRSSVIGAEEDSSLGVGVGTRNIRRNTRMFTSRQNA